MNRGSTTPKTVERMHPPASMRPRFMNRGSAGAHRKAGKPKDMLQ